MTSPVITVLMPVYNAEKYLNKAIDSILNQTYTSFEFLIINDGSEDTSEQIVLSYNDHRIRYIKNEENLGIIASLNKGIDLINTDYIVRMDADDISLPNRLQMQKEFMDEHPEIGVSSGHIKLFGKEDAVWKVPLENEEIKASLLFNSAFCHPASIIRTSILKENKIKYNYTYLHLEDYDLWYRMKDLTNFANLDQVLLHYRFEGQNITITEKAAKSQRTMEIYKKILSDIGIEATEEELKLHLGLGMNKLNPTPENIKKYKEWLEKINSYCKKGRKYSATSVAKIIDKKWEQLFYQLPPCGFWSVISYLGESKKILRKHLLYYLKFKVNRAIGRK